MEATDENMRIYDWRLLSLLAAGYNQRLAHFIAERFEIDLHEACDLVREKGCDPDKAWRILR